MRRLNNNSSLALGGNSQSQNQKHQNIRIRVLPPLVVAICFLQAVFIFTFSGNQQKRILETQEVTVHRTQDLLREVMESDTDKMSATLDEIVRDPQMMEALDIRDREALVKRAQPLFERLKKYHQVTHFYFHQPDRINLLRLHKKLHGDLINRITLKNAQATGQPSSGLEQGPTGNPVLRVVYPWRNDFPTRSNGDFFERPQQGKLVGFVELGIEFEDIASRVSQLLDIDLIIFADKRFLERKEWESRNKKLGRQSEWNDFQNAVIIDKTIDKIDPALATRIADAKANDFQDSEILSLNGKSIQISFLPLQDLNGQNLGKVIALKDITGIVQTADRAIWETLIGCFFIGTALCAFFYILIGRVERDLAERTEKLAEAKSALERSNEILEQRVAERTTELSEAKLVADKANQAKSDFLANMSHELRTPLNGILGYAQILGRSKALPDKERHGVNIIHQCGSHLLTLINDVLDISKIEARKLELAPQAIHLPSFLQSVVEICRIRAEQKGLEFTYAPGNNLPQAVYADEKRLRQVLINLLGNATKFTDTGSVTFKVEVLETTLRTDTADVSEVNLHFAVTDTGMGIAPDQVNQIFKPFEQVGDRNRHAEGTGLGLAISTQIVQLMGSQIQVKSQLNVGSDFFFEVRLPLAGDWAKEQRQNSGRTIIGYEGDRRSVLIIDDRWENRSVVVSLLEPLGFDMIEAQDGQEGLIKAAAHQPDLIITDLAMPGLNGFEMLLKLRSDDNLKHLKVIVSSASVSDIDRQHSVEAGGDDFLAKPVQADELFKLLQTYLNLTWINEADTTSELPSKPPIQPDLKTINLVPERTDLENLLRLAQQGRLKKLIETVQQLGVDNSAIHPFVQHVTQLAQTFQTEKLESWLEELLV